MSTTAFNPYEIAEEIIEILAKHELKINAVEIVFETVREELQEQQIISLLRK